MAEDEPEPQARAGEEVVHGEPREPRTEPPRREPAPRARAEPGLTERIRAKLKKLMDDDPNIYPLF